jgi:ParB-like chromosome segregation protein Spo0J
VTCEAATALPLDLLLDFQGGIKTISDENLGKLKRRIVEHGINAPVFVWRTKAKKPKHYIIDGHQRCMALRELRDEGYTVPDVPVAFIEAKSKKDAADKLLAITSQYGNIESAVVQDWIVDLKIEATDIRLVDGELDIQMPEFEPVPEEEQGSLDHVGRTVVCPNCGAEIDA